MDFSGPAEVIIISDRGKSYQIVTIADTIQPVTTMGGIKIIPDYTFRDAPLADILVVPGGDMAQFSQSGRYWLKSAAEQAEIILSVCYGSFLLAEVGLLDGVAATTHHWGLSDLQEKFPSCQVISGQRFVHSGKIVSSAGVTAGIDAALYVVELQLGKEAADWTAQEWMEHKREM